MYINYNSIYADYVELVQVINTIMTQLDYSLSLYMVSKLPLHPLPWVFIPKPKAARSEAM